MTPEAIEVDDAYKQFITDSDGSDTVYTHAYDAISPFPWPTDIGERVRRNEFTGEWSGREAELRDRSAEISALMAQARETAPDSPDIREVMYGQSAGAVSIVQPAAEVIRSITEDASQRLRIRVQQLNS